MAPIDSMEQVEMKKDIKSKSQSTEQTNFDLDYSMQTIKSLHALSSFSNIKNMIENSTRIVDGMNR